MWDRRTPGTWVLLARKGGGKRQISSALGKQGWGGDEKVLNPEIRGESRGKGRRQFETEKKSNEI